LAGPKAFIEAARRKRKIMGGGMRQAGVLAAAGLLALGPMRERLAEDHRNAAALAEGLARLPGVRVLGTGVRINMVFLEIEGLSDAESFSAALKARGILVNPPEGGVLRLVTHYWIKAERVSVIVSAVSSAAAEAAGAKAGGRA
jgi:threonine aldolase